MQRVWNIFVSKITDEKNRLVVILVVGLIHGLIYVFMIPLWMHHEEPGHFEYAWLVANRQELPQRGDYDNDLRRQIAESMFASGQENYYNVSEKKLDDDPIWIGMSPIGLRSIPIYHWIISLPLRIVHNSSVVTQLYVARLTSLLLFILSLWLTWLVMGELVEEKHPLRWMLPVFLALLPGYLDTMTSVHDDVLGVVAAAFFIWLSTRWIKKGWSPLLLIGWLGSLLLCYYDRETTKLLILLEPIVPLSRLLKRKAVPVFIAITLFLGTFFGYQWITFRDAAQWYYFPAQQYANRIESTQAPFGNYAFSLEGGNSRRHFGQSFAPGFIKPLREKTLTLGVWIWADQPTKVNLPIIQYRTPTGLGNSPNLEMEIGAIPIFYTTTFYIPYEAGHMWLIPLPAFLDETTNIYFDGFVLAEGEFSSLPPAFDDEQLSSGVWDEKPFVNLIRNPSAENAWFGLHKTVDRFPQPYIDLALFLQTVQDTQGFGWYYKIVGSVLFQGFWGKGAGTQIPLLGSYSYKFLQIIVFLSILGISKYLRRFGSLFLKAELFLLGSVILAAWLPTIFRGTTEMFSFILIVPYARYAFPAIIPTAFLFSAGFLELLRWVGSQFTYPKKLPALFFLAFCSSLASYALFSFGGYFYPWVLNAGFLLFFGLLMGVFYIVFYIVFSYLIRSGEHSVELD